MQNSAMSSWFRNKSQYCEQVMLFKLQTPENILQKNSIEGKPFKPVKHSTKVVLGNLMDVAKYVVDGGHLDLRLCITFCKYHIWLFNSHCIRSWPKCETLPSSQSPTWSEWSRPRRRPRRHTSLMGKLWRPQCPKHRKSANRWGQGEVSNGCR